MSARVAAPSRSCIGSPGTLRSFSSDSGLFRGCPKDDRVQMIPHSPILDFREWLSGAIGLSNNGQRLAVEVRLSTLETI